MSRRWSAGEITDLPGARYRVVQGTKSRDDLRLERLDGGVWRPVYMAEAFAMVDFFHENEEALRKVRPNWRRSGGEYFLTELVRSAREGWQVPATDIVRQRERAS